MPSLDFILALAAIIAFLIAIILYHQHRGEKTSRTKGEESLIQNLNELAEKEALEFFAGRTHEIARIVQILMRRTKNNPLLLGNPGVGKTAIVHGLAQRIIRGEVPPRMKKKVLYALDLPGLMSGSQFRGELERRLKNLLHTLEKQSRESILFIDEVHMLDQMRGSQGGLNITDMLKPALARGELQVIGATTWKEYQETILQDPALARRFQPVVVDEPDEDTAIEMLHATRGSFEKFHNVIISDEVIAHAVRASRMITSRFLPDKAIDLVDEASAKVSIATTAPEHLSHLGILHSAAQNRSAQPRAEINTSSDVSLTDIDDVLADWVKQERA